MTATEPLATAAPPLPAPPLLDDIALIERIFEHIEHGTTDLGDTTWQEPVANYLRPERLHDEIERVLRRRPTAFCPLAAVPSPGSYVAREAAGVGVIVVRGHDGEVRAFRNACRHRGTALADGHGCAAALVCPFHGWVYRLDGTLRHIPGAEGFPGLDPAAHGLVPLATAVRGGIVFVAQVPSNGPVDAELDALPEVIAPDQEVIATGEIVLDANWKILVEGFLEGYHIKATHRTTFFPFGFDNLNVIEPYGRNCRVTFPFRRIAELRGHPPDTWRADRVVTTVHHLFPNAIVARLSHHTSMVVLEPLAPDRTRFVTYQLTNRASGTGAGAREDARRDQDFVNQGLAEDRAMALAVQRGLATGANEVLEFGRFEGAIVHFHDHMRRALR